jgi:hypothetical protein
MGTPEQLRQRDRRVSTVRRVTLWVSAGSLAVAGGVGAILGVSQPDAKNTTTTSGSNTPGGGFTTSSQAPGSSPDAGGVTSGGS